MLLLFQLSLQLQSDQPKQHQPFAHVTATHQGLHNSKTVKIKSKSKSKAAISSNSYDNHHGTEAHGHISNGNDDDDEESLWAKASNVVANLEAAVFGHDDNNGGHSHSHSHSHSSTSLSSSSAKFGQQTKQHHHTHHPIHANTATLVNRPLT
jgi:hypothetical protein